MYVPSDNDQRQIPLLHELINSHPLGTWIASGAAGTEVNHIPFLLQPEVGRYGTLVGHLARANAAWKMDLPRAIVCFQGPQSYISPGWYPSKTAHGKAVPTWNYAVVHAHGECRFIHDRDWLYEHVRQLSEHFETGRLNPWSIEDAPRDFIENLVGGIVGIEIPIDHLVGKWKTSRNRSARDKESVVANLLRQGDDSAIGLARLMRNQMDLDLLNAAE